MSDLMIGFGALGMSLVLIVLRFPIGLAIGGTSLIGIYLTVGLRPMVSILKTAPFEFVASWELSAIPLFLFMGAIAYSAGMTQALFEAARIWLARLPGGLAVATNFACAGFSAASGNSLATTIAMGRIAIPEMRKYNYDISLTTGVVAASGTLGALLPPSILLVIFGIFAEQSIPKLFIAGIVPALLTAVIYAAMIVLRCTLNPALAPRPPKEDVSGDRFRVLVATWPLMMLVLAVVGSIYTGLATATEAGAIGVVASMGIAAVNRRLTWLVLRESLRQSVHATASVFFIAIGAVLMTRLMTYSGVPLFLADLMSGMALGPVGLVLMTAALYLVLGCLIDPLGMVLLTLPVLLPMFKAVGIDLIWFGILVVKFIEIGLITPPIGLNVFSVRAMVPDVAITTVFRGTLWFLVCELIVVGLLIAFPGIVTFLVR
ncbi:TRAP transporter large permease [Salipiger abyssi]|uniref:TRAP transporter large permease n=1 Tax=Salipiger abyssi TaxID=1250539 RepID=UPI004058775A